MKPIRLWFGLYLLLAFTLARSEGAPAPFPKRERESPLPVGRWTVTFVNGVIETCEVRENGAAHVADQVRSSPGQAKLKDGAVLVLCDDDRLERWKVVNGRMVVEHWFPASSYPNGTPVRGEAKRKR